MVFGIGVIYIIIQVKITLFFGDLNNSKYHVKRWLVTLRLLIMLCLVPLFFITTICSYISGRQFTGKSIEYWTEEDGGFILRLIGTFSEWSAVLLMMCFISTFSSELKNITFRGILFETVP
ncbi:hypothetical protein Trydic_g21727 [Trypoxylus dichotomus]